MCEDMAHRRLNLNSILEACESQHKASILPSPTKVIKRLAEEVFREPVSIEFCCNCFLLYSVSMSPYFYVIDKNSYCFIFFFQVDQESHHDSNVPLSGRSQVIRERLHGAYACLASDN